MRNGSAALIYFTNTEKFGSSTAASQYLLQMASFLGMPVIAWNADNSGLEKVSTVVSFFKSQNHDKLTALPNYLIQCVGSRRYLAHEASSFSLEP